MCVASLKLALKSEADFPRENDIVIKNDAVAINPVEWAIQDYGRDLVPLDHLPTLPRRRCRGRCRRG